MAVSRLRPASGNPNWGRRKDDVAVAVIATELRAHVDQCKIDKAALHGEIVGYHTETKERFDRIYDGLKKLALGIFLAFLANYLAQHGLTLPGAH